MFLWEVDRGSRYQPRRLTQSPEEAIHCVAWGSNSRLALGSNRGIFYQMNINGESLNPWEGGRVVGLHYKRDGHFVFYD